MTDLDRMAARAASRSAPKPPVPRPPAPAPDSGRTSGRTLTVLLPSVAYFMVTLDVLVVVTALPSIHRDLGGSVGTLQWTVNAYNTTFAAGIITAAALGDRLGRRRLYVAGITLFAAASAACRASCAPRRFISRASDCRP